MKRLFLLVIGFMLLIPACAQASPVGPTPTVGTVLTAPTVSFSGGTLTDGGLLYVWQQCDSNGLHCTVITGATASTYTVQSSDVGFSIRVEEYVKSAHSAVIGSGDVGTVESAPTASFSGVLTPMNPTQQFTWHDCNSTGGACTLISGATSQSYTVQSSDVGFTLEVWQYYYSGYTPVVVSGGPAPAMVGNPTNLPVVSGNTVVGSSVSATTGTWANSPTSYAYQWQDCVGSTCSNISGATSSSYTVQSSDVGQALAAVVTATNANGSTPASSFNTSSVSPSTVSNFIIDDYLLAWALPSGCSSFNAACMNSRDWAAGINQTVLFNFGDNQGQKNEAPTQYATTTGSVSGSTSSIPANVTTTIPAGPVMLTTNSATPSSGNYQIYQTTGAASGATSIPVTTATANATYAPGSAVMVWPLNGDSNSVPSGSSLASVVSAIHSHNATALIGLFSGDEWTTDCVNGYQYLLGAYFADYITANNLDGMEIDDEQGSGSSVGACWTGIGEELHSVATAAGKVPVVKGDFNQSDAVPGSYTQLATAKTNIDEPTFEYYGFTYDNNCSDNCQGGTASGGIARALANATAAGFASQKMIWISCPTSCQADSSLESSTVLGTTTSSLSNGQNIGSSGSGGIPVSGIAAVAGEAAGSMPAGLFILSDTNTVPTTYQFLETSGVTGCGSGCTIPVTGACTAAGFKVNTGTCSDSATVDLNAAYASGDDIYFDPIGYPAQAQIHTGPWDCGAAAAYAKANNMLGVSYWFDDGDANAQLCLNVESPF